MTAALADRERAGHQGGSQAGPQAERRLAAAEAFLTADEERNLARRSAHGDPVAEARLVLSHRRLVERLARAYGRLGLPVADLVQEGTIGLIQAVRRFNPDRDARLSTYAAWWVRAAIQEHVVRSWSLVRVGKTAAHRGLFFALRRRGAELTEAGLAELAERFRLPLAELTGFARRALAPDLSLTPATEDGPSLLESLACPCPIPEEVVGERRLARLWSGLLEKAVGSLPDREAHIIRRRHLSDPIPTFEAIGRELGVSKDRVRQLEQIALDRLRDLLRPMAGLGLPDANLG